MSRVAVLKIGQGSFEQGFAVTLQLREDYGSPIAELEGRLPANLEIESLYLCWQQTFRSLTVLDRSNQHSDDWEVDQHLVTHRSTREDIEACRQFAKALEMNMGAWLQSTAAEGWQKIRERLARELASYPDRIRVVVQAREPQLWKLPWQAWDLLRDYPQVGVGYSFPDFEQEQPDRAIATSKLVRILAVLGDRAQLDLTPDETAIQQLKQADTIFLHQPTAQELIHRLRDDRGWDLFFFAGHSHTEQQTGKIALNDRESLEVDQFRNALREAIRKGLKIAIFNSCDGLGLAQRLASLNIAIVIFMQEKVPDSVAQSFLKEFLSEYEKDQSLYTAVRRSQERLEEFQNLPGATWLPILYQNPADVPPTWQALQGKGSNALPRRSFLPKVKLHGVMLASLLVASLTLWARSQGILQAWELQAFDQVMRQQPIEPIDPRLVIVGADEEDIRQYGHPIPDATLAQLLQKLKQGKPAAIGVDIVRDQPVGKGQAQLIEQLSDPLFVPICSIDSISEKSIAPPQKLSEDQLGFVDLHSDEQQTGNQDSTVRRYLLSRSPNPVATSSRCPASYSFALQLSARYFQSKKIAIAVQANQWQLGSTLVRRLARHSGGYQNLDDRGNQSLIRYRRTLNPQQIARQITFRDVLRNTGEFKSDLVVERVVLVGITAPSIPDLHNTPYGRLRGLQVHAHSVSQLLSAVEDRRRLIHWLPFWGRCHLGSKLVTRWRSDSVAIP
ncbi:MAG: CHASE2 domain-containing protein [Leptolyngbyaceae cyanobacterium SU_3_3]|nr:CHASE2 domain-containing protein [Leptolyngbyaceae cyanobacterium SU_3_3]